MVMVRPLRHSVDTTTVSPTRCYCSTDPVHQTGVWFHSNKPGRYSAPYKKHYHPWTRTHLQNQAAATVADATETATATVPAAVAGVATAVTAAATTNDAANEVAVPTQAAIPIAQVAPAVLLPRRRRSLACSAKSSDFSKAMSLRTKAPAGPFRPSALGPV